MIVARYNFGIEDTKPILAYQTPQPDTEADLARFKYLTGAFFAPWLIPLLMTIWCRSAWAYFRTHDAMLPVPRFDVYEQWCLAIPGAAALVAFLLAMCLLFRFFVVVRPGTLQTWGAVILLVLSYLGAALVTVAVLLSLAEEMGP